MNACALAAAALALAATSAQAAGLPLIVGFAPGQGPDSAAGAEAAADPGARLAAGATYEDVGRFYTERLGAFLPGAPSLTEKLVPGAGGLIAARMLAASPANAPALALLGARVALEPLANPQRAPWRASAFPWIGALTRTDDVCVARADSGVANAKDLRTRDTFMATLAPGSRTYLYARALNEFAGARLKIVSGYGSAFEATRALETGETQAWCGFTANDVLYRRSETLRISGALPLFRFSVARDSAALGLPLAEDLTDDTTHKLALRAVAAPTRFSAYALAAPPATPAATVAAWRAGFLAMARDPETLRLAGARGLEIDPVPGEELQALAQELDALPTEARAAFARVY